MFEAGGRVLNAGVLRDPQRSLLERKCGQRAIARETSGFHLGVAIAGAGLLKQLPVISLVGREEEKHEPHKVDNGTVTIAAQVVLEAARAEGFELAGLTAALPHRDFALYEQWVERGLAAGMGYLTDHRRAVRADPRELLGSAKTMLCVGKLYNAAGPSPGRERGWISRYAWGARDYHDVMREGLERVVARLGAGFEFRIVVDTAPLLERSYAREAGLGWIGKNTCLINEPRGSWFFLAEILFSFEVDSFGASPPDRCGSCTRCIDACPTAAIVPVGAAWELDSGRCISYWTIEAKTEAPEELKQAFGNHLFGCDICQDVCPWNRQAPETAEAGFQPVNAGPELVALSAEEFRSRFRGTPVSRAKADGYNRNVRVALENRGK